MKFNGYIGVRFGLCAGVVSLHRVQYRRVSFMVHRRRDGGRQGNPGAGWQNNPQRMCDR